MWLERIPLVADERRHFDRVRTERPDHRVVAVFVRAQDRVRVVVLAGQQPRSAVRGRRCGLVS